MKEQTSHTAEISNEMHLYPAEMEHKIQEGESELSEETDSRETHSVNLGTVFRDL